MNWRKKRKRDERLKGVRIRGCDWIGKGARPRKIRLGERFCPDEKAIEGPPRIDRDERMLIGDFTHRNFVFKYLGRLGKMESGRGMCAEWP
jgi:hypothetical protein